MCGNSSQSVSLSFTSMTRGWTGLPQCLALYISIYLSMPAKSMMKRHNRNGHCCIIIIAVGLLFIKTYRMGGRGEREKGGGGGREREGGRWGCFRWNRPQHPDPTESVPLSRVASPFISCLVSRLLFAFHCIVCIASLIVSCPLSPLFCLPTVPQPQKAPHRHHALLLLLLLLRQHQQQQALSESPHAFLLLHPFASPLLAALSQPLPLLEIRRSCCCLFCPSSSSSSPPSSPVSSVLLYLRWNG